MIRLGAALMLSVWLGSALAYAATEGGTPPDAPGGAPGSTAAGQGGNQGAGWFDAGQGGTAAADPDVAELARLQEQIDQDGMERQTVSAAMKLIPAFESKQDNAHLAECLTLIGEGCYRTGQWASAEKYMRRAWDVGLRAFGNDMSTFPLKVLGEAEYEQHQYDSSLSAFTQRVQVLRERGGDVELPGALFDEASMLTNLDRAAEALPLLQEALVLNASRVQALQADTEADPGERQAAVVDSAEIAFQLALTDMALGKNADARPYLEQANTTFRSLPLAAQQEYADRLVAVLDHLVMLCEQLGEAQLAETYRAERDALNQ
jgi:tetratricopeptide (TPR) repeat protein